MLSKQFESDPHVALLIPDGPDAYWCVFGTRYTMTHGDEFPVAATA
jgi:hypothetical protein